MAKPLNLHVWLSFAEVEADKVRDALGGRPARCALRVAYHPKKLGLVGGEVLVSFGASRLSGKRKSPLQHREGGW